MSIVVAVVAAVAVWWVTTAAALYRLRLPRETFAATFAAATLTAIASAWLITVSAGDASIAGAVAAFVGAIGIWSWHEVAYLLGYVSGPAPQACNPQAGTLERFGRGVLACLHHELAIIATAIVLWLALASAANPLAAWIFSVLWLMRWSTKLNIFLGVRNLHTEYWPAHLRYLVSYTRERSMNALFPLSLAAAIAGLWWIERYWFAVADSAYHSVAGTLLMTLLGLAVLEHVFLMLKVPDDWLWRPALRLSSD